MWLFPGMLSRTPEGGMLPLTLLPGESRERWHVLEPSPAYGTPQTIAEGRLMPYETCLAGGWQGWPP